MKPRVWNALLIVVAVTAVALVACGPGTASAKPNQPERGMTVVQGQVKRDPGDRYGRIFLQPPGYFVEVDKDWLFVVPGKVCRPLGSDEQRELQNRLKELAKETKAFTHDSVVVDGRPLGSLKPDWPERISKMEKRTIETFCIPANVQEYLHKTLAVPLVPNRLPPKLED